MIAVVERLYTTPMTSDLDGREHQVTDEVVHANLHKDGLFKAVCGAEVWVVSVMQAPGRPCDRCRREIAAARRAATVPPQAAIPEQSRRRHQHRRGVLALLPGGRR